MSREEYDLRYDLAMGEIDIKRFYMELAKLKEINDGRETYAADKPQ